ncbi:MAG: YebC/PmpR family DNA-binding transcriptional regulator [Phycisphaerae bacterium]|nr:YebC/PmpR family DNA-binding transcriptional regulator [Phycisphaerae bacterium]
MSGHSHWARIKHKKGVTDSRRGKLWSKLARNIIVAARAGGGDPSMNLSLRYCIDKAKEANMPNDTIDRAIKRGTGDLDGASFEEITYEGYGPNGVAIMVVALTDNRNRTAPEIRKIFEHRGGSLGGPGSVSWMFEKRGVITVSAADATEEQLMEATLEAGAEDIREQDTVFEIHCPPTEFENVKKALADAGIAVQSADLTMLPQTTVALEGEAAKKMLDMMELFEDHDDVQNVYANFDIPEELIAESE